MKVWCLVYKEKNMNIENNVLEYDEVCPFSEGRAAVRKGEFWGYVDENGKLVSTDFTRSGMSCKQKTGKTDQRFS